MNDNELKTMNLAAIRIKCAEIVGWRDAGDGYWWTPSAAAQWREQDLPNYPESAAAAIQLVKWMSKRGWILESNFNGREWSVSMIEILDGKANRWITKFADTLALAVSLAFLKANNIEPETL